MVILRILFEVISVIVAALAGNWLGGEIRSGLTGQPVQAIRFQFTTAKGQTVSNIPVVTKFYPALFAGLLGTPRWLTAFLAGVVTGALVDERVERLLWRQFEKNLPSSDGLEKSTGSTPQTKRNALTIRVLNGE
jgi:hypothetical protein